MELLHCIVVELTNDINQGRWPNKALHFNSQDVVNELQDRIQGYKYQEYLTAAKVVPIARN